MTAKMAAIFDFTKKFKYIGKMRILQICFAAVVKYDTIKHFAAFGSVVDVFVHRKEMKNTHFYSK